MITGGTGGAGGSGGTGAVGGSGGAGVANSGMLTTLTNAGMIKGGLGGLAGSSSAGGVGGDRRRGRRRRVLRQRHDDRVAQEFGRKMITGGLAAQAVLRAARAAPGCRMRA